MSPSSATPETVTGASDSPKTVTDASDTSAMVNHAPATAPTPTEAAFDVAFLPEELADADFDMAFLPEERENETFDAVSQPETRAEAVMPPTRLRKPEADPADDAGLPQESLEAMSHAARLLEAGPDPLDDALRSEEIPEKTDALPDPITDWILTPESSPESSRQPQADGTGTASDLARAAATTGSLDPRIDAFIPAQRVQLDPSPPQPPPPHPEPPPPREEVMEPLEDELVTDSPSREWWIIPLVAALLLFLAGIGAGRYLIPPWARDTAPQTPAKPTVVTMAGPMAPAAEAQKSHADTPATVTDAQAPVSVNPATTQSDPSPASKPEETPTPATQTDTSATPARTDTPASDPRNPSPDHPSPDPSKPATASGTVPPLTDASQPAPESESLIDLQYEESLPHEPVTLPTPPPAQQRREGARVAVVIDDLGYNVPVSLAIARLPHAITLAILPGGEVSRQVATIGKSTHKEIILHQPMEPMGYPRIKPGPGALLMGMGADEIRPVLKHNLDKFPEAIGINNHMGSRITQYRPAMDTVMELLKERGLFFLDSRTSQTSVAFARAKTNGVPAARRDVFLDNIQRVSAIEARLAELEHIARVTGHAIGIGHPYRETLTALQHWLPAATKRGIRIEGISHFLTPGENRPRSAAETRREQPDKTAETDQAFKLKRETSLVNPAPSIPLAKPTPQAEPPTPAPVETRQAILPPNQATTPALPQAEDPAALPPTPTAPGPETTPPPAGLDATHAPPSPAPAMVPTTPPPGLGATHAPASPAPATPGPALIPPIADPIAVPPLPHATERPQTPTARTPAVVAPVKAPPSVPQAKSPLQTPATKSQAATPTAKKPVQMPPAAAKKPAPAAAQTKKPAPAPGHANTPARTPATTGRKPATPPAETEPSWTAPPVFHDPAEYVLPVDPNP
ncbi:MAG: divergent polysaccharide deacetylase family protein [Magnetococcales bacterium]|nr:divergent polysaccharide deacetylase family protein [Magnetococcales bacterium]